jgi:hypothetical protein
MSSSESLILPYLLVTTSWKSRLVISVTSPLLSPETKPKNEDCTSKKNISVFFGNVISAVILKHWIQKLHVGESGSVA